MDLDFSPVVSPAVVPMEHVPIGSSSGGSIPGSIEQENQGVNCVGMIGDDEDEDVACRVCSDRATGNHYNVYTCEGCKG